MTTFLRKVKPARLNYYEKAVVQEEFGLGEGEYLSDLLADFATTRGEFSIFEVTPDDPDEILLVLCAIAAKSNSWKSTAGYLLFDSVVFDNPDIATPVKITGETANPAINDRHYNVPVITTNILTQITNRIIDVCLVEDPISGNDMRSHLIEYGQRGMLPNADENIKKKLDFT